jgi:hypothetical protein
MKNVLYQYKVLYKESQYVWGLILGFSLLILSFIVANKAGEYASQVAGHRVDDLILSYLPLVNVTFLHVYAAILFWVCFIIYMFTRPQIIPFVTKTSALFIFVRSIFICLTHLGAPVNQLSIPENVTSYFLFDGDLFFSGHVGGPFLLMLLFWSDKKLRFLCLFFSLFFAYIVLIGHIHYSIDVFAAPFITYGVYALACMHALY